MKSRKIAAVALSAVMVISACAACSSNTKESGNDDVEVISTGANGTQQSGNIREAQADDEGYFVMINDVKIRPNADLNLVLSKLPSDYIYFEAPSCAGIGMAKNYTFNNGSYVISTIPLGEKDLVSNIVFFNDSISTPEGIFIGSSVEDVKKAYGEPTSDIDNTFTYELNDTMLVIVTDGTTVTSIVYNNIVA